jgi:hypothetical protein
MAAWTPTTYAEALRRAAEAIELKPDQGGGWRIALAGKEVPLPETRIGQFPRQVRRELAGDGEPFLDLATGTLSAKGPGMLVYVRLGRRPRASGGLTPFQCALLARALIYKKDRQADLLAAAARDLTQPEYARRASAEWEVPESSLTPVVVSRFLEALRREGILNEAESTGSLDEPRALEVLRRDFRLSAVGRAIRFPARREECEPLLKEALGDRFCCGVAYSLYLETKSWVEPVDYLVDPSAQGIVREILGRSAPAGYSGPTVLVRPARRVPLALLRAAPKTLVMNPLLAMVELTRAESAVARQSAESWWREWTAST